MKKSCTIQLPGIPPAIFPTLAGIPGLQMLFVGPFSCTRHGIYTSMLHLQEQLSFLCISDVDVITGAYLEKTVEAAREITEARSPSCMIIITCCQNAIIGTDYRDLTIRIQNATNVPVRVLEINRLNMYTNRKCDSLNMPTDHLVYDFLIPASKSPRTAVNLIGSPYGVDKDCEFISMLQGGGITVRALCDGGDFEEYLKMATTHLNIILHKKYASTGEFLKKKLGIPWLPLYNDYNPTQLAARYSELGRALDITPDIRMRERALLERTQLVADKLSGIQIVLDGGNSESPMEICRWLLAGGFDLAGISLHNFSTVDLDAEQEIKAHWPAFRIDEALYCPSEPGKDARMLRNLEKPLPQAYGYLAFHRVLDTLEKVGEEVRV